MATDHLFNHLFGWISYTLIICSTMILFFKLKISLKQEAKESQSSDDPNEFNVKMKNAVLWYFRFMIIWQSCSLSYDIIYFVIIFQYSNTARRPILGW